MSEQKWAVMRGERGAWIVSTPDHTDRDDDGRLICWDVDSIHDTWTEAMQEADRMARTVTVTLPRAKVTKFATDNASRRADMRLDTTHDGVLLSRTSIHPWKLRWRTNDQAAYIPNSQLQDVALALLAHARRRA